ncbi:hypothetical protein U1Q18_015855 [Sarracenia purpurea var. burkii]
MLPSIWVAFGFVRFFAGFGLLLLWAATSVLLLLLWAAAGCGSGFVRHFAGFGFVIIAAVFVGVGPCWLRISGFG